MCAAMLEKLYQQQSSSAGKRSMTKTAQVSKSTCILCAVQVIDTDQHPSQTPRVSVMSEAEQKVALLLNLCLLDYAECLSGTLLLDVSISKAGDHFRVLHNA